MRNTDLKRLGQGKFPPLANMCCKNKMSCYQLKLVRNERQQVIIQGRPRPFTWKALRDLKVLLGRNDGKYWQNFWLCQLYTISINMEVSDSNVIWIYNSVRQYLEREFIEYLEFDH